MIMEMERQGIEVSGTGVVIIQQQLDEQGLEGLPVVDTKTYKGWIQAGFKVRRGEKSTLKGITWVDCSKEDDEETMIYPKEYHLFHSSQVEDMEVDKSK